VPNTSNLGWVYPANQQVPFFSVFVAMINAMDADAYGLLEYQRTVLCQQGTVSMNYGTNTLSWTEDLEFISAVTGIIATVTGPGSISLPDGTVLWVTIPRPMVAPVTLTVNSGGNMSSSRGNQLLALRRGSTVGKSVYLPALGLVL